MSRATGFEFLAGRLEDLGYAQWGGGYVTSALWGVPSVLNIERKGYWKFGIASPSPTLNLIEFHSQAMAVGYSNMNMTKESARILLDALAANGTRARTFRGKIGESICPVEGTPIDVGHEILWIQVNACFVFSQRAAHVVLERVRA